jgi:hypothetical protein
MFTPFAFVKQEIAVPSFVGLLDTYSGATVAYSVRKLSSSATNAIRVRRDNDNSETDIGFVGEALDTTSLASFVGVNSAYVVKWYDQSGNSNDAIQTADTASQPRIVNAGTLETINSLPALLFDASNDYFDLTSNIPTSNTAIFTHVFNRTSSTNNMTLAVTGSNVPFGPYWFSDNNFYYAPNLSAGSSGRVSGATGYSLVFTDAVSGTVGFYRNNSLVVSTIGYSFVATNYTVYGRRATNYYSGKQQEFVLWDIDYGADRTDIQDNINAYYSIY